MEAIPALATAYECEPETGRKLPVPPRVTFDKDHIAGRSRRYAICLGVTGTVWAETALKPSLSAISRMVNAWREV